MFKSKILFLFSVLTVTALATGCKREGCMDSDSKTYDPDAKKDDGSCTYEGSLVFWYDQSVANYLVEDDAVSLTYYLDGQLIGSSAANVYWTGAPECGQSVSVTKGLGESKSKAYTYEIRDQTGWVYWSGVVNIDANSCLKLRLNF